MLQRNQDQGRVEEGVLKLKLVIHEAFAKAHGSGRPLWHGFADTLMVSFPFLMYFDLRCKF
jgi:hypothetical protein